MLQRTKLRARSPDREMLAEALAAERERTAQVAGAELALQTATEAKWSACAAVERATKAVEQSHEAAAAHAIAVARGTAGEPPQTVLEAQQALRAAEAAYEGARQTEMSLRSRLEDLTRHADFCRHRTREPAARVIASSPEGCQLLADVQRLRAELMSKSAELQFLVSIGVFNRHEKVKTDRGEEFSPAATEMLRIGMAMSTWQEYKSGELPSVGPWRAAFEALLRDPDAELPSL